LEAARILVVDDDESITKMLRITLSPIHMRMRYDFSINLSN
jgi:DNA-binding NtrC family response regulator